ncbi:hypothetical protein TgHK011_008442 [Trichoderma gracile]|nr:hypothetical protein TgHK011_008442 [Trichoderma gracile]
MQQVRRPVAFPCGLLGLFQHSPFWLALRACQRQKRSPTRAIRRSTGDPRTAIQPLDRLSLLYVCITVQLPGIVRPAASGRVRQYILSGHMRASQVSHPARYLEHRMADWSPTAAPGLSLSLDLPEALAGVPAGLEMQSVDPTLWYRYSCDLPPATTRTTASHGQGCHRHHHVPAGTTRYSPAYSPIRGGGSVLHRTSEAPASNAGKIKARETEAVNTIRGPSSSSRPLVGGCCCAYKRRRPCVSLLLSIFPFTSISSSPASTPTSRQERPDTPCHRYQLQVRVQTTEDYRDKERRRLMCRENEAPSLAALSWTIASSRAFLPFCGIWREAVLDDGHTMCKYQRLEPRKLMRRRCYTAYHFCSIEGKSSRHPFSPAAAQTPINMMILQGCVLAMFASEGLWQSHASPSPERRRGESHYYEVRGTLTSVGRCLILRKGSLFGQLSLSVQCFSL